MENLDLLILNNLCNNELFVRRAIPHIKPEYFMGQYRVIYDLILDFISHYNKLPTSITLDISYRNSEAISRQDCNEILSVIKTLSDSMEVDLDWLLDSTEKWCQSRAINLAIMKSVSIIDGTDTTQAQGAIPDILSKALSVSFAAAVGHDYTEDGEARYDAYHRVEDKISFDIDMLNKITNGGVTRKTLNVLMAGCVHPDTLISTKIFIENEDPVERTVRIANLDQYLKDGLKLHVDSPDGWVPVIDFIDKGLWQEHILMLASGAIVRCNENHLFETVDGWQMAKDLVYKKQAYLTHTGYEIGIVHVTDNQIPIVDITIDSENHRYYTNGVSSHNTGVGKSLAMCHLAAASLAAGRNVLYITLEMSEEKIAERIDANLFDVDIKQLVNLSKESFARKVAGIKSKTLGKLIIKEYPTASAHVGHFRALLSELKLKKNFVPDVIFIDYLNICASSRIKGGLSGAINSYSLVKSIAEELRGLAVEFNVPVWSATQSSRQSQLASDVELTDVSESIGLVYTVDLLLSLISTEQLEKMGQIMIKQLKNRYSDVSENKRFTVGLERCKMRLYDISDPTANIMSDSVPLPDVKQTPFMIGSKAKSNNFNDFKM